MTISEEKKSIREKVRTERAALSQADRSAKNNSIANQLETLAPFQTAQTILFYVSTDEEVDTHHLIQKHLPQKTIIVPTVDPKTNHLELFHLKKWEDLSQGHYGILEIHDNKRLACHPNHIDLIIVPGIAFDKNGHRIGYGKGYYDRLLKNHPATTIGLAYELQITEKLPTDPHDIPVQMIVTENQIITT
mgnify:CR=1 FL=1